MSLRVVKNMSVLETELDKNINSNSLEQNTITFQSINLCVTENDHYVLRRAFSKHSVWVAALAIDKV